MLRIVLDTNVLISALLRKHTPPYQLYDAWRQGAFELITSNEQLSEISRVMSYEKLQCYFTPSEAQEMLIGISTYGTVATSLPVITLSPDPDDNKIIATAIAGHADYIVSGDKSDMLSLHAASGIPIITAKQAINLLE